MSNDKLNYVMALSWNHESTNEQLRQRAIWIKYQWNICAKPRQNALNYAKTKLVWTISPFIIECFKYLVDFVSCKVMYFYVCALITEIVCVEMGGHFNTYTTVIELNRSL